MGENLSEMTVTMLREEHKKRGVATDGPNDALVQHQATPQGTLDADSTGPSAEAKT